MSKIETKMETIEHDRNTATQKTSEYKETVEISIIEIIKNKEKIDSKIRADFDSAIDNLKSLPQLNKVEITIQEELNQKKKELKEINEKRSSLEQAISEQKNLLRQEDKKNFLIKFFRVSNREQIREQIKALEQKQSELKSNYDLSTNISSAEQALKRIRQERQVGIIELIEQVALETRQKYENLKNALAQNEKLKIELDEQLIAKELTPKLEELKEKKLFNQKQVNEYLELVREQLQEGSYDSWNFYDLPEEKRKEIEQRREQFNQFDQLSHYQLDDLKRGAERMSIAISNIFDLLTRNEAHKFLQEFSKNIEQQNLPEELASQIKQNIDQIDVPKDAYDQLYDYWHQMEKNPENIPLDIKAIDEKIFSKYFLTNNTLQAWDTVKSNPYIQKLFSEKAFSDLEQKITEKTLNELLKTREHTDKSVSLGYRLLKFKNIEAMPFIIMNCWREPGYSGEMPFLSIHADPQETKAYELIASLTEKEIDILKTKNIPGLIEVIESVRSNPKTFSKSVVDSPDWTKLKQAVAEKYGLEPNKINRFILDMQHHDDVIKSIQSMTQKIGVDPKVATEYTKQQIENPVYITIHQNLAKMCLHMMQEKDERKQFFVMGLLKNLNVDLGEGYKLAENILKQSNNPKLQSELLEMVLSRYNDFNATLTVIRSYPELAPDLQEQVKQIAPELLSRFLNREDIDPDDIKLLSTILNKEHGEIQQAIAFINEVKDIYEFEWGSAYSPENLESYIDLAKQTGIIDFVKELNQFDYRFNIKHVEILPQMAQNKEKIISDLQTVRQNFPDFKYQIYYEYKYNPETQEINTIYNSDPYYSLLKQITISEFFNKLYKIQQRQGQFSQEFTNGLMLSYYSFEKREKIEIETYDNFYQGIQKLIQETLNEKGKLKNYQNFYFDQNLLKFIAQNPEKIDQVINWPKNYPHFFQNLEPGGLFYSNKENIVREFLSAEEPEREIAFADRTCTEKIPYWKFLFFWTDRVRLKKQLKESMSKYPITKIADIPLEKIVDHHKTSKEKNPTQITRLERIVENPEIITQLEKGEINSLPFSEILGGYKRLIFRDYLRKTIENSRDEECKQKADLRNRELVSEQLVLKEGTYIHASPVDVIDSVLLSGNLPGEALGEESMTDAYPFHTDFSRLIASYLEKQKTVDKILLGTISSSFGMGGELSADGQIFYIYQRNPDSWEGNKTYLAGTERDRPREHHGLILGGMPATEISAIVLRNHKQTFERVRKAIIENGFYIPIYDLAGKLLFSIAEYDNIREDLNLSVPVEVWDYSLETSGQKGSNPGAEITIPSKRSPEKYYVKFEYPKASDQIWVEKLAEDIYRELEIPVPETKVVMLTKGTTKLYGHASLIVEGEHKTPEEVKSLPTWKQGFIADALMANWDIPYAPERNVFVGKDNTVYRLDNGGALIYRARGQKKSPERFGSKVHELGTSSNKERLGFGMQQEYPNLTKKNIQNQVKKLKVKLTDGTIDSLVDGIRLAKSERDYLKQILKQRRDYIISHYKNKI